MFHNIFIKNNFFIKKRTYSMNGEDTFVNNYFKKKIGFYVDVGAYHPLELSNTYLLYKRGWNGINIDINSFSIDYFDYLRPDDININIAASNKNTTKTIYYQKSKSPLNTLNPKQAKKIFLNNFKKKKIEKEESTIEKWAIENFGKYLFLNFFKPYTEQFWKINTNELSHRVIPSSKKMDFANTLKHLLIKKYLEISRREPGKLSLIERESLPTYYPEKGFGEIANRIGKIVLNNSGEIFTNCEAKKIYFNEKLIKVETNKKDFFGDFLISTIPLNSLVNKLNPTPPVSVIKSSQKLEYLCLILVYIITKKKNVINCQYCYFINKPYNRISEMNYFSKKTSPEDENILSIEISCHHNDKMWNLNKQEIFDLCMKSIKKDKFLNDNDVINFKVVKIPDVYPIYRKDYDKNLIEVNVFVKKQKNFFSIGRQGQFYYGDIDQMARFGFDTATKIITSQK